MRLFMIGILWGLALPVLASEPNCRQEQADGSCALYSVSIIELIANPRAWDGKPIEVTGYLDLAFESQGIYLHHEDAEHGLTANGLWITFSNGAQREGCESKNYVTAIGKFNAKGRGHRGAWSGEIEQVTKCFSVEKIMRRMQLPH